MPITGAAKSQRKCRARHPQNHPEWIYTNSFAELGERIGIDTRSIHKVAQGIRNSCYG